MRNAVPVSLWQSAQWHTLTVGLTGDVPAVAPPDTFMRTSFSTARFALLARNYSNGHQVENQFGEHEATDAARTKRTL